MKNIVIAKKFLFRYVEVEIIMFKEVPFLPYVTRMVVDYNLTENVCENEKFLKLFYYI
jgi:hypothetical protein